MSAKLDEVFKGFLELSDIEQMAFQFKALQALQQKDLPSDETAMAMMLSTVLQSLMDLKPNDRSITDRRYAIVITELEKVIAYYETWVLREMEKPDA